MVSGKMDEWDKNLKNKIEQIFRVRRPDAEYTTYQISSDLDNMFIKLQ